MFRISLLVFLAFFIVQDIASAQILGWRANLYQGTSANCCPTPTVTATSYQASTPALSPTAVPSVSCCNMQIWPTQSGAYYPAETTAVIYPDAEYTYYGLPESLPVQASHFDYEIESQTWATESYVEEVAPAQTGADFVEQADFSISSSTPTAASLLTGADTTQLQPASIVENQIQATTEEPLVAQPILAPGDAKSNSVEIITLPTVQPDEIAPGPLGAAEPEDSVIESSETSK